MNTAVIFAGGTGIRMNSRSRPKQFLELHGKPILVYTLEAFEEHPEIDAVVLVVLRDWMRFCGELIGKYGLRKVRAVVPGGETAFASQRNGLTRAAELFAEDTVVLIHDGVRPLVAQETISKNIACVKAHGNAITVTPAIETIALKCGNGEAGRIIDRSRALMARAPQSFVLRDILEAHRRAEEENREFIDSASLMQHYGYRLHTVEGTPENIKITTPADYYIFRALVDAREDSQIFGI